MLIDKHVWNIIISHFLVNSYSIQLIAELTFKESTKLYGYLIYPVLSIHKLISACLDKCGETPEPYEPNINNILLYLLVLFFIYYLHYEGVIGLVVC